MTNFSATKESKKIPNYFPQGNNYRIYQFLKRTFSSEKFECNSEEFEASSLAWLSRVPKQTAYTIKGKHTHPKDSTTQKFSEASLRKGICVKWTIWNKPKAQAKFL